MRIKGNVHFVFLFAMLALLMLSRQVSAQSNTANPPTLPQFQHQAHDQNGDGLCDVCKQPVGSGRVNAQGQKAQSGKHWGPGDGTGNQGQGPKDGTGYGAQSGQQSGPRDGSGPSGLGTGKSGSGQGRGQRGGIRP
jgi:hypothetical protein